MPLDCGIALLIRGNVLFLHRGLNHRLDSPDEIPIGADHPHGVELDSSMGSPCKLPVPIPVTVEVRSVGISDGAGNGIEHAFGFGSAPGRHQLSSFHYDVTEP